MAFSPSPLLWSASEVERLLNSAVDPEDFSSLCQNPWSLDTLDGKTEYGCFNLDLDFDVTVIPLTEEVNLSYFCQTTESSFVLMEPPVNHEMDGHALENCDPCDTSLGLLSNTASKKQNVVGQEADQECDNDMDHEPMVVMLDGNADSLAASCDSKSATTEEVFPSLPCQEACTTAADTEPGPEIQMDDEEEATSKDDAHLIERVEDENIAKSSHAVVKDVAKIKAVQNKAELDEHACQNQDVPSEVSEHGLDQDDQTTSHSFPDQNGAYVDPFVRNNRALCEQLVISVTGKREREVEAPMVLGAKSGCEVCRDDVCPSHQGTHQIRTIEAQEESEPCKDEANDKFGKVHLESEENENGTLQGLSKEILGSKDNPILLNDEEEESSERSSLQPNPIPTRIGNNSANLNDKSSLVTTHSLSRSSRKRKRSIDGMQAWGSAEFQESETENLQSAWLSVQRRWRSVETLLSGLKAHHHRLEPFTTEFKARWFEFCVEAKHSESIDSSRMAELIDHWKKVERELGRVHGNVKKKKVLEFRRALDWLEDKVLLCDCIEAYSSPIDRKDEDLDEDYQEKQSPRPSKTRRQRV